MATDYEPFGDCEPGYDDEESYEPVASCDECQGDVYEDELWEIDGFIYCDQCAWYIQGGN